MQIEQNTILYDYRENKSKVPEFLNKLGVKTLAANIKVDYAIGNYCLVERKTVSDFVTSLADGRLFRQVSELHSSCKYPLLLLEGGGLYRHERVSENTIRGVMIWITIAKQVPILRTYNEHDTACMLQLLARRFGNQQNNPVREKKKSISLWQRQMNILVQIHGIGWQAAKDILSTFGTIECMAQALDVELMSVPRLGKKRVEAIRSVFPRPVNML